MNLAHVRQRLSGDFRPFSLRTSDGREYFVRQPYLVLVGPRTLAVLDRKGEIVLLDPLHVVAVKDLPVNGRGRRTR